MLFRHSTCTWFWLHHTHTHTHAVCTHSSRDLTATDIFSTLDGISSFIYQHAFFAMLFNVVVVFSEVFHVMKNISILNAPHWIQSTLWTDTTCIFMAMHIRYYNFLFMLAFISQIISFSILVWVCENECEYVFIINAYSVCLSVGIRRWLLPTLLLFSVLLVPDYELHALADYFF